jgi:hypothetical protein
VDVVYFYILLLLSFLLLYFPVLALLFSSFHSPLISFVTSPFPSLSPNTSCSDLHNYALSVNSFRLKKYIYPAQAHIF